MSVSRANMPPENRTSIGSIVKAFLNEDFPRGLESLRDLTIRFELGTRTKDAKISLTRFAPSGKAKSSETLKLLSGFIDIDQYMELASLKLCGDTSRFITKMIPNRQQPANCFKMLSKHHHTPRINEKYRPGKTSSAGL